MSDHGKFLSRRRMIQGSAAGLLAAGLTQSAGAAEPCCGGAGKCTKVCAIPKPKNEDFYSDDGKFDAEKARKAYYAMFERFHWPISRKMEKEMWIADFNLGDFAHVGMAGIFWVNDKKYDYFGHEIFLLPGQMIVEHAHVAIPGVAPKMESWQVRHGSIYTFGEGEPTKPCPVELPESQEKFITVRKCQKLEIDEIAQLNRPEAKHFMVAGPAGAIVTEYATYHDNAALRFTNPGVAF